MLQPNLQSHFHAHNIKNRTVCVEVRKTDILSPVHFSLLLLGTSMSQKSAAKRGRLGRVIMHRKKKCTLTCRSKHSHCLLDSYSLQYAREPHTSQQNGYTPHFGGEYCTTHNGRQAYPREHSNTGGCHICTQKARN